MKKSTAKTTRKPAASKARPTAKTTRKPAAKSTQSTAKTTRKSTTNPKQRHLPDRKTTTASKAVPRDTHARARSRSKASGEKPARQAFSGVMLHRFLDHIKADQTRRWNEEGGKPLRVAFIYNCVVIGEIFRYHVCTKTGIVYGMRGKKICRSENFGLIRHFAQFDWSGYWPIRKGETSEEKPLPEARKIRIFKE